MSGETNLATLLAGLRPHLAETEFAFAVVPEGATLPPGVVAWATIHEAEGLTVIAPAVQLETSGLEHTAGWAHITLEIHSSLEAVGLTPVITRALADEGISANVVAGFYHDHLFVPWARRHDAVRVLERVADGG